MQTLPERIAIIGGGRVGTALQQGFAAANWPSTIAPAGAAAKRALIHDSSIVVLAIPFEARRAVVDELAGALDGKIVIDVTNPLKFPGPEFTYAGPDSGAQELQRWLPKARVVKAFNTVFSAFMSSGSVDGQRLSVFAASDDGRARQIVLSLARDMGFDAVDAGPLSNARGLEQLLFFEMMLEKVHGSRIGWRFIHPAGPDALRPS